MNARYLILNCDDFGMCHSANVAVDDALHNGCATSATLMVVCPWAEEAVAMIKNDAVSRVGVHLCTTSEWEGYRWGPILGRAQFPSLVDEAGYLPRTAQEFMQKAMADQVGLEMQAQLHWMLARGCTPTHIDNHMGTLYGQEGPSFLEQTLQLAARHLLPFRLPRNVSSMLGPLSKEKEQLFEQAILFADDQGVGLVDTVSSFRAKEAMPSYETIKEGYLSVIRALPQGVHEVFMHPAVDGDELRAIVPLWQQRVWEHRLLTDDHFAAQLDHEGFERISWQGRPPRVPIAE